MMSVAQAPVYVLTDSRSESGPRLVIRRKDRQRRELFDENARLAVENARLAQENARLAEENSALREAADLWIRLYEKQLERANDAVQPEP